MSQHTRNFDDPLQEIEQLKRWMKQRKGSAWGILAVIIAVLGLASSYYQVEPDEVGVVLRFGKHQTPNAEPGPHFRIPFGIDRVIKVPVQRQLKMEFGFRTLRADIQSEYGRDKTASAESEMLTGDLNVGVVEWIVQYKVASPEKYLFRFRDIDATLRLMSEATMRAVVGDHSVDEILTGGREAIEIEAKRLLIELNKLYDTGISIQQLKLQDVNVPESVRSALREVEEAKQEKERVINEAFADYNRIIPKAEGQAKQALEEAEGYRLERVNRATGNAMRFKALYTEYRKAPTVTRTRLYLEAMNKILPKAKRKIIIDSNAKGILPLLNLSGGTP